MGLSFDELQQRLAEQARAEDAGEVRLVDALGEIRRVWRHDRRGCPGDEDLAAYSEGSVPWKRRLVLQWHVWRCGLCRTDLADLHAALTTIAAFRPPLQTREAQNLRQWWPWMLAGVEAVVILILILQGSWQRENRERQAQLRQEVHEAIEEGLQDAVHLLRLVERAQTKEVVAAVRQVHVVSVASHGRLYPYPTWHYEPTNPVAFSEGLSRFSDLENEYEEYLQEWIDIFLDLGQLFVEAGKVPEAIQVVAYLLKAHPDDKRLLYTLGRFHKMGSAYRKAIAIYEDMIARGLAEQDPRPAHYAGRSYYTHGRDYTKALKYYDDALRIDPGYAMVWYNKALVLRDLGHEKRYREHLDQAHALALQAYKKVGDDNPRIPFTLAMVSVARGALDEALVYLERALRRARLYMTLAEHEPAFEVFRDPTNEPYSTQFQALLERYRPLPRKFGAVLEATYDPSVFYE